MSSNCRAEGELAVSACKNPNGRAKSVAIGGDSMRAGPALGDEALGEKGLQHGANRGHGRLLAVASSRSRGQSRAAPVQRTSTSMC